MEQVMGHYGTRPSCFPEKAIQLSWNMYFAHVFGVSKKNFKDDKISMQKQNP